MRHGAVLAAVLLSACGGSSKAPDAGPSDAGVCEQFAHAYLIAAIEARRCDPDEPDPCRGRAPESLETQCIGGFPEDQAAQLLGYVEQYKQMGCTLGPPVPCPLRTTFRCEQDGSGFVCVGVAP
ncbi:hypothetical protein FGE12_26450 [Aggregicoccus sp. 17bor-14]|uniref:hypothetical protein n=1 Tax=Myxococcaceae TaxID=31 RepID=UPI00129C4F56|nr:MULTISPECIES: hypothetical protein [Myxococcaceae]MBF5045981.1 hypothetical protein [Simulacricoccus sp. 17bor-14]MRI91712.1 hypothetical protein [Aggregicoccus sp. 17bor-14]